MGRYPTIIIIITLLSTFSCEESLPPIAVNKPVFSVKMYLSRIDPLLDYYGKINLTFVFEIDNLSDEVVEDTFFFAGTIECYVNELTEPYFFTFTEERERVNVVLIPGQPYKFGISWDQVFDSGEYLAEFLSEVPGWIDMRSKAEIQIFRNLGVINTAEIEYKVGYGLK